MALKLLLASLLLISLALPARAQIESREAIALRNQILEVQHELDQLRQQVEAGGGSNQGSSLGGTYREARPSATAASGDLVATLLQQVSSLQDQVRTLRGQVDDLTNKTDQQVADLGKKVADLQFQFQLMQGKGTGAVAFPPPPPPAKSARPVAPAAATPPPPEVLLHQGELALARSDYAAALNSADTVLKGDSRSPRAYDAQFLAAQALFGEKQFTRAALAYDDAYSRDPAGSHAQDSLLGLARSLVAINQKPAACGALSKLHQQFPRPRSDIAPAATSLAHQAHCG
ncbi:MAG: hypothetical protein ACREFP_12185 [Acetobacteraceae bacterium]